MPYKDIDKLRSYKKEWAREKREKYREYYNQKAKKFYHEHREEINIRRRKNPFSLYAIIKRNAEIRKMECLITKEEFKEWWDKQEQKCVYCEIPIERLEIVDRSKKLVRRLSIDRKINEVGYLKNNLVLSCMQCNFIKSNLLTFDEMKEIGQKYLKPKWQL